MGTTDVTKLRVGPLLALLVVFASADVTAPTRPTPSPQPRFELSEIIRRAHFAFRDQGDALEGAHTSYRIRLSREGLAFRPIEPASQREGAELRIRPAEISRGEDRIDRRAASLAVEAPGSARLDRGPVIERIQNSEHGSEQTWGFDTKPEGEGDLRVRLQIQGLAYAGVTSGGLHFRDERSGLGVRYGHGTWIDARGHRHAVPATWTGDAIQLLVPGAVLDGSEYPAVLDPVISPQREIDAIISSPLPWDQNMPAVASDGAGFLVVWVDGRHGGDSDLFGARVDASGALVDPAGFPITSTPQNEFNPRLAFGAGVYLVTWESDGGAPVRAARVSTSGTVLDPTPLELGTAPGQTSPAVGFDGTQFLVAYSASGTNGREIFGAHVRADGTIPAAPFLISNAVKDQHSPAVGCGDNSCLVAWTDHRGPNPDVYATRVAANGAVIDGVSAGLPIATTASAEVLPGVSFGDGNWLVTWDQQSAVRFAHVSSQGAVTGGSQLTSAIASGAPEVSFNGQHFQTCYRGNSPGQIACAFISTAGALGVEGIQFTGSGSGPVELASAGTMSLLVWSQAGPYQDFDIHGMRLDAVGARIGSDFTISVAANIHDQPTLAYGDGVYLAAWSDYRNGRADIYGVRVDPSGNALSPNALQLSTNPELTWDYSPVVAFGEGSFLLVWPEGGINPSNDIFATVVSSNGTISRSSFRLAGSGTTPSPAVVFDGSSFLVVWVDSEATTGNDIVGIRVDTDGTVLDTPFVIAGAAGHQRSPSLAFTGQETLVVFEDHASGTPDLATVRVPVGGVPSAGILPLVSHTSAQRAPDVDCGGGQCLVTWLDERNGPADVYATRVDASGTALDGSGIRLSSGADASRARVTFDGSGFLAVWRRSGLVRTRIEGARIDSAGALTDPALLFFDGPGAWGSLEVASHGSSTSLLIYEAFKETTDTQANRAVVQTVWFGPNTPQIDVRGPWHLTVGCSSVGSGPVLLSAAMLWLAFLSRRRE